MYITVEGFIHRLLKRRKYGSLKMVYCKALDAESMSFWRPQIVE
jgi:hypothetical protein